MNKIIQALNASDSTKMTSSNTTTTAPTKKSAIEMAYERKIKLGIPKLAIRREMESKGIDAAIVDRVCGTISSGSSSNAKKKASRKLKNDEDVLKELLDESSVFSGMFQEQKQNESEKKSSSPKSGKKKKKRTQASTLVLDSSRHMAVNMTSGVLFTGCSGSQKKKLQRVRKLCNKLIATNPKQRGLDNEEICSGDVIKKTNSLSSREIEMIAQTFEAANLSADECKRLSSNFQEMPQTLVGRVRISLSLSLTLSKHKL